MPTNGFTQGRYKPVYTDTPAKWYDDELNEFGAADFSTSLGFTVGAPKGGGPATVRNVNWDSPTFKARIAPGITSVSAKGVGYSAKALRAAILDAEKDASAVAAPVQARR